MTAKAWIVAASSRRSAARRKTEKRCASCGETFRPYSEKGGRPRTLCISCKSKPLPKLPRQSTRSYVQKVCPCGCSFIGSLSSKYCSARCQRAANTRRPWRRNAVFRCVECHKAFAVKYGDKRHSFCRKTCANRYSKRIAKALRRARKRGDTFERVDPLVVFARDLWRCQICGVQTPKRLRGTLHDTAPELDHRIPLALGGGHTWANCQCACRKCNRIKGGTLIVGQLPLFPRMGA